MHLSVVALAAALFAAGCGTNAASSDAPAPMTQDVGAATATSGVSSSPPASKDGVVSAGEAAQVSELVGSDEVVAQLRGEYGGVLSTWQPAELEGEARGAAASIELAAPVAMAPVVIRAVPGGMPTRVEDYVLERVQLDDQVVERYGVFVDLVTMTIVHLAPMPAPPTTSVPPSG